MDIRKAKANIKDCAVSYFAKKPNGQYLIPPEKQRPVFMMGPPGVGKTDVAEQAARELGVPFLSYSMAHHTRQSVLGLPYLSTETYNDREFRTTAYTLSELFSEVYRAIRDSGKQEGILFLDEINCCSETLSPILLGFLQKKTLGTFRLPEGWMIVTAGNTREYNSSVREFDAATADRIRMLNVEPSFDAWKEYSLNKGVHPSVIAFLDIYNPTHFYRCEKNPMQGQQIVTARSWSELSDTVSAYEELGIEVTAECISQFLRIQTVYNDYFSFYMLYSAFYNDFDPRDILDNRLSASARNKIDCLRFDEKMILTHILLDTLLRDIIDVSDLDSALESSRELLSESYEKGSEPKKLKEALHEMIAEKAPAFAEEMIGAVGEDMRPRDAVKAAAGVFNRHLAQNGKKAAATVKKLHSAVTFLSESFGEDSAELTVFLTELLLNEKANAFVFRYGALPDMSMLKQFRLGETERRLKKELEALDWRDERKESA